MTATFRTLPALIEAGLLEAEHLPALERVAAQYAVAVTPAMADLMDDPHIARQFLPDLAELTVLPGEDADPVGDNTHMQVEGIVHR
ncbi:hypothetical protein BH10PSE5_BH10PSE5_20970 [soil metagenome]